MKNIILISMVSLLIFSCKKDENYTITHDNIMGEWEFVSGSGEASYHTDLYDFDTVGVYDISECPNDFLPFIRFYEDNLGDFQFHYRIPFNIDTYSCDYNSNNGYHTFEVVDGKVLVTNPFGNIEWHYKFKLESESRIKFEYEINTSPYSRVKNTYIFDRQ